MKIIYQNKLEKRINDILTNPIICYKCGCMFQIENKKEILCNNELGIWLDINNQRIYSECYYIHCPNCARTIDLYKREWRYENGKKEYL